jgi:hypothetical protein
MFKTREVCGVFAWREREKETAAGDLVLRERNSMKAILRGERDTERS